MVMTVIKLIIASTIALGNDEVYYWTYALNLEWNYFDHPPFVAWLIRVTTVNLYIHNELAVRLGAIISSTIGTIIKLIKAETYMPFCTINFLLLNRANNITATHK